MVGRERRRTRYSSFSKNNHGTSPIGKRRLIRWGVMISHPGGGALSTVSCARTSAWTLSPKGARDRLWTPDEQTYPPLGQEPVDRSVRLSVDHRLNYQPDRPQRGLSSTIATSVTLEPVSVTVHTGAIGAMRDTGRALPSRRLKTLREELYTNRVIMSDTGSVAAGAIPSVDVAGNVAIGRTSLLEMLPMV